MRKFVLGLALVAMPALGFGGVLSVRLYTQFQQAPPHAVMESLENEVTKIMSPMGLEFEWRSIAENKGNELSAKVAVIRFTGRCDVQDVTNRDARPGALGWTYLSDDAILPFSDIDCDSLRAFLQPGLVTEPKEERAEAFGRALGRVLAHELYHIFADTTRHSSRGIAKPSYTWQELLSTDFQFAEKDSEELRRDLSVAVTGGF